MPYPPPPLIEKKPSTAAAEQHKRAHGMLIEMTW
jgi:hypothetical protein